MNKHINRHINTTSLFISKHMLRTLAEIKRRIKSIKLTYVAMGISIVAIFISLFAPIIVNDYLAKPEFIASSYIYNNSLYISVFNTGLGVGTLQSVGYCYYNTTSKSCLSGSLMNFQNFLTIKSKEGQSVKLIDNPLDQARFFESDETSWAIIFCELSNDCFAYVFDNYPRCQVERSFINGEEILNRIDYQNKRFKISFKENTAKIIDPEFKC